MRPASVRIQFEDDQGAQYSININGKITKESISKIAELYNFISNVTGDTQIQEDITNTDTLLDRITKIIHNVYPTEQFTSHDIREAYEDSYNEPIQLAAVSTYLSRMNIHGSLSRTKIGRFWSYRVNETTPSPKQSTLSVPIPRPTRD